MIRLDKYLCDCGIGTRSEVKKIIKAGRVSVDGGVIKKPEDKLYELTSIVTIDGKEIIYETFSYFLFHKPSGCVTATEDNLHKTVMDYFSDVNVKNLAPVGRLDLDTEGLLLVTNDGELAHHLISPSHHVEKTYYVEVDNQIPPESIDIMREGILMDGKLTKPASLKLLSDTTARLTITEGKFHQVKRMFAHVGCQVTYLKRETMGTLTLGDLQKGCYRKLTQQEIETLKKK